MLASYLTGKPCDFTNFHSVVPEVHERCSNATKIQPRVFKSHSEPDRRFRRVVYLVRDGRDVAVSFYYHALRQKLIDESVTFEQFLTSFNTGHVGRFSSWNDHVCGWLQKRNEQFFLFHYEDILTDPEEEFTRLIAAIGLEVNPDAIHMAVAAGRFARMQRLESEQHDLYDAWMLADKRYPFVRSGRAGTWRRYFTESMEREFTKANKEAMELLSYV